MTKATAKRRGTNYMPAAATSVKELQNEHQTVTKKTRHKRKKNKKNTSNNESTGVKPTRNHTWPVSTEVRSPQVTR
jgi:phage repressor protein C with HTH and peptisase S24 domain